MHRRSFLASLAGGGALFGQGAKSGVKITGIETVALQDPGK